MDAVEYLKERDRMCDLHPCCEGCPFMDKTRQYDHSCEDFVKRYPEEAVSIVEKWSREHPVMTNAMKFEEIFGKWPFYGLGFDENGVSIVVVRGDLCDVKWWGEPYVEPTSLRNRTICKQEG